jgi:YggT family protein
LILLGNLLIGIGQLLSAILSFMVVLVFVSVLLSWFRVNPYNPVVRYFHSVSELLCSIPRRWFRTTVGNMDLAPVIVLLALSFLQTVVANSMIEYGALLKASGMYNVSIDQRMSVPPGVKGRSL